MRLDGVACYNLDYTFDYKLDYKLDAKVLVPFFYCEEVMAVLGLFNPEVCPIALEDLWGVFIKSLCDYFPVLSPGIFDKRPVFNLEMAAVFLGVAIVLVLLDKAIDGLFKPYDLVFGV
jgi:hypothetical protein